MVRFCVLTTRGSSLPVEKTERACTHLAGVQPVLQWLGASQAGDDQVIEGVLTCQRQQGSAHPDAQEHEQAWEVLDPHLESLRRSRRGGGGGILFT